MPNICNLEHCYRRVAICLNFISQWATKARLIAICIVTVISVLADKWFGQSIWYDNLYQTNIIDYMIW